MSRKLNNKEWQEFITKYYENDSSLTISDFCKEHGISKQQFHYHKKRISESKTSNTTVFQGLEIKSKEEPYKKEALNSEVKIIIRNATISIPASETGLISSIIKELAL